MKKIIITFLTLALLSACGQQKEKQNVQEQQSPDESATQTEGETDGTVAPEQEVQSDLDNFPEFEALTKNIDLNKFKGVVETDNGGNRIILFKNEEGQKVYKSIFIKNNKLLEIIKLDDEGILFKEFVE